MYKQLVYHHSIKSYVLWRKILSSVFFENSYDTCNFMLIKKYQGVFKAQRDLCQNILQVIGSILMYSSLVYHHSIKSYVLWRKFLTCVFFENSFDTCNFMLMKKYQGVFKAQRDIYQNILQVIGSILMCSSLVYHHSMKSYVLWRKFLTCVFFENSDIFLLWVDEKVSRCFQSSTRVIYYCSKLCCEYLYVL